MTTVFDMVETLRSILTKLAKIFSRKKERAKSKKIMTRIDKYTHFKDLKVGTKFECMNACNEAAQHGQYFFTKIKLSECESYNALSYDYNLYFIEDDVVVPVKNIKEGRATNIFSVESVHVINDRDWDDEIEKHKV